MSESESAERRAASGYSSNVELFLVAGDQCHRLAQIAPQHITLREPVELQKGEAEIVMRVDGEESRWPVFLTHGAVPFDLTVETVDR